MCTPNAFLTVFSFCSFFITFTYAMNSMVLDSIERNFSLSRLGQGYLEKDKFDEFPSLMV